MDIKLGNAMELNNVKLEYFIKFLRDKYYITPYIEYDCECCGREINIKIDEEIKNKSLAELINEYFEWFKIYEKYIT